MEIEGDSSSAPRIDKEEFRDGGRDSFHRGTNRSSRDPAMQFSALGVSR